MHCVMLYQFAPSLIAFRAQNTMGNCIISVNTFLASFYCHFFIQFLFLKGYCDSVVLFTIKWKPMVNDWFHL